MKLLLCAFTLVSLFVGATVMLAPRSATADGVPRCEAVTGLLAEDPGDASQCPADHPRCFVGAVEGPRFRATTLFYNETTATAPATSPGWYSYSGVITYTFATGSIVARETGLGTTAPIPEGAGRASLSMEVITGGTGEYAGATGYLFVNGFVDPARHVSSLVMGKICQP